VPLPGRGATGECSKYGLNIAWDATLYPYSIRRFKDILRETRVGEPIAGIGQGNGAGPQIWAVVSSP